MTINRFPNTKTIDTASWYVAIICPRCGGNHRHEQCPDVRAVEYYPDGRVKRIEYFEGTGARPVEATITVAWRGRWWPGAADGEQEDNPQ